MKSNATKTKEMLKLKEKIDLLERDAELLRAQNIALRKNNFLNTHNNNNNNDVESNNEMKSKRNNNNDIMSNKSKGYILYLSKFFAE